MPPKFKNMDELMNYLTTLEKQVQILDERVRDVQYKKLPKTNLISKNFIKRSFAVWGHFFIANLIITLILGAIYIGIAIAILGNVSQSKP
ncbi:MAG: hypothetical protein HND47_00990 [Chloroflexi bacterium]|nr:hypothetical protein [Chloroflexota bacterium]